MIRLARDTDIDVLEKIYIQAKAYLRSIGNNIQWTGEYPSRRTVSDDIALKRLYVCEYDGIIAGAFALCDSPDPTYGYIEGKWRGNDNYKVIHRMVSAHTHPRVAKACIQWCQSHYDNLRIETHQCNAPMLTAIAYTEFTYSGTVYMADGTERMAFEWLKPEKYEIATNTSIETPRLLLRPWKQEDVGDLFEYASDKDVGPDAGWLPHSTPHDSLNILNAFIKAGNVFAIQHKQDGKVIGSVGIHHCAWNCQYLPIAGKRVKEIGYVLSKNYHNRGLMTEAINHVTQYCFDSLKLDAVTASCFSYNVPSRRVMEKNKMLYLDKVTEHVATLNKEMTLLRYYLINPTEKDR